MKQGHQTIILAVATIFSGLGAYLGVISHNYQWSSESFAASTSILCIGWVRLILEHRQQPKPKPGTLGEAHDNIDTLTRALVVAAAQAFGQEISSPRVEQELIGPGKQFASRQDWVDRRIDEWLK